MKSEDLMEMRVMLGVIGRIVITRYLRACDACDRPATGSGFYSRGFAMQQSFRCDKHRTKKHKDDVRNVKDVRRLTEYFYRELTS